MEGSNPLRSSSENAPLAKNRRATTANLLGKLSYYFACISPLAFVNAALSQPKPLYDRSLQTWDALYLSYCCCPFVAIVLGGLPYLFTKRGLGFLRTSNYGISGMLLGVVVIFLLFFGMPIFLQGSARSSISCLSNAKQLSMGLLMYAQDYDEKLPPMNQWNEGTYPYIKNAEVYRCPYESDRKVPSYALNRWLQNVVLSKVTPDVVLIFDSVPGANRSGSSGLFPNPSRHQNTQTVGFVDGHAKSITPSSAPILWDPLAVIGAKKP